MAKSHENDDKLVAVVVNCGIFLRNIYLYLSVLSVSTNIFVFDLIGKSKKGIEYAIGKIVHTEHSFKNLYKHQVLSKVKVKMYGERKVFFKR